MTITYKPEFDAKWIYNFTKLLIIASQGEPGTPGKPGKAGKAGLKVRILILI